MTEAQVEISLSEMDVDQQAIFQLFVGLGFERSLAKLEVQCKAQSIKVSLSTLKRWSSEFKWVELAQVVGRNLSNKLADAMLPEHLERAKKQLEAIDTLEDRFYDRLRLDPASLDEGERNRAIDVNLNDFFNLIKTRRLIMGDPTERREQVHTVEHNYSQEDINRAAAALMANKYGLPVAPTIKTIEHDEKV